MSSSVQAVNLFLYSCSIFTSLMDFAFFRLCVDVLGVAATAGLFSRDAYLLTTKERSKEMLFNEIGRSVLLCPLNSLARLLRPTRLPAFIVML